MLNLSVKYLEVFSMCFLYSSNLVNNFAYKNYDIYQEINYKCKLKSCFMF